MRTYVFTITGCSLQSNPLVRHSLKSVLNSLENIFVRQARSEGQMERSVTTGPLCSLLLWRYTGLPRCCIDKTEEFAKLFLFFFLSEEIKKISSPRWCAVRDRP
ncbi:hypothetical protein GDO78_009515 [Eleutherodactylus coqui]|uniref:Uncharacterized protein n=1 Tax=Eleutherodactylus coqui TaxID=57060 RepID=A0A8J6KCE7_ELECQ|nr:hypothetical protein GDO78_009515 [Eleutherodactylus coqui]